jgi:hypothetical protein
VNFSAHPLTLLLQRTAAPQSSHRTRAKVSAPSIDDGGEDWQRRRRQCWSIGKRQAWRSPPAELHACHYFRQLSHATLQTFVPYRNIHSNSHALKPLHDFVASRGYILFESQQALDAHCGKTSLKRASESAASSAKSSKKD